MSSLLLPRPVLDKEEFAKVLEKSKLVLDPPFDLEADWEKLNKTRKGVDKHNMDRNHLSVLHHPSLISAIFNRLSGVNARAVSRACCGR